MANPCQVSVRVDKWIDGHQVQFGVPVRFRPVREQPGGATRRVDQSRETITAIAPVSGRGDGANVYLSAGKYDVEAVLPSGEQLFDEIEVPEVDDNSPDPRLHVVLRGSSSPNEWRSWSSFAGSVLASVRQAEFEQLQRPRAIENSFEVSIGTIAEAKEVPSFNPSRWDDWFQFLQARYERGPAYSPGVRLNGGGSGLTATAHADRGSATRIQFVQQQHPDQEFTDPTTIGRRRIYAAISAHSGTRIVALPWPWGERVWNYGDSPFELLAYETEGEFHCDPVLRDDRWGGLVAYFNRGRVDLAATIFESARDALMEKFQNPLAAAIGGYVLLSTQRSDEGAKWPDWLENLSNRFPYLPDGQILRARYLLAQKSDAGLEEAHELLFQAVDRGIPFFTTGIVWLIEGLQRTSVDCPECAERLEKVRGVARAMDLSQAFTSFSVSRPATREEEEGVPLFVGPAGAEAEVLGTVDDFAMLEEPDAQVAVPPHQFVRLTQG